MGAKPSGVIRIHTTCPALALDHQSTSYRILKSPHHVCGIGCELGQIRNPQRLAGPVGAFEPSLPITVFDSAAAAPSRCFVV